jgi:cytoplasmic iron level regulating protein YaaA (DUF328/UPF0246 family)
MEKNMLAILSPSKTMSTEIRPELAYTLPVFEKEYRQLVRQVQKMKTKDIQAWMQTSDKLTAETKTYFDFFPENLTIENAGASILSFKGDVYQGLSAGTMQNEDLEYANQQIRILSGLYGVLKPLDLMAPYRLEMGLPAQTKSAKNMYGYWGKKIASALADALSPNKNKVLINLASAEYFKSVSTTHFPYPVYHAEFRENKNGKLTGNAFTNKRMRGVMARHLIQYRLEKPEELKAFSEEGFVFSEAHSTEFHFLFIR